MPTDKMYAKNEVINSNTVRPKNDYEDDDDIKSYESVGCGKLFALQVLSDSFFIVGSILYIWLAVVGIAYSKQAETIPKEIFDWRGDDAFGYWEVDWYQKIQDCCGGWEDDYIVQGPDLWISRYQTIYFFAAVCFVFCGLFASFLQGGGWHIVLSIIFICASCCGVGSAVLIETHEEVSMILNAASVHIYLIDGIGLAYARYNDLGRGIKMTKWKWYLLFGDLSFALGSGFDVAQSWSWRAGDESVPMAHMGLWCAIFWLLCALVYFTETLAWGFDCLPNEYGEDSETDYISGEVKVVITDSKIIPEGAPEQSKKEENEKSEFV